VADVIFKKFAIWNTLKSSGGAELELNFSLVCLKYLKSAQISVFQKPAKFYQIAYYKLEFKSWDE